MTAPSLPPPPTAEQITLLWLLEHKQSLAQYLSAAYALANLQVVVTVGGVRQPPVAVKLGGTSALLEIKVS